MVAGKKEGMIFGTRISLSIGLVGVLLSMFLGIIIGEMSGYYGGAVDNLIQRLIEILRSFPTIPMLRPARISELPTACSKVKRSGVKIGSQSVGDFFNIHVSNCLIRECGAVAVKITLVDGGSVRNISFSDLKIENCTAPVFLACGNRGRRYTDHADDSHRSLIRDIVFRNIVTTTKRYKETVREGIVDDTGQGIVVSGCPDQVIRNIRFEKINVAFWAGIEIYSGDVKEIPYLTDEYPEVYKLGLLPSYAPVSVCVLRTLLDLRNRIRTSWPSRACSSLYDSASLFCSNRDESASFPMCHTYLFREVPG